ncbi:Uncharacterised protein [Mycobacteroides abscessus subsp. abscessus]|nr:Uncharacterised protein [Mycobacteroides abscessus subsp. abscessus]SLG08327.1 Uncharacterised protein [Mycobacteroides abscessus subsp. abscessus]
MPRTSAPWAGRPPDREPSRLRRAPATRPYGHTPRSPRRSAIGGRAASPRPWHADRENAARQDCRRRRPTPSPVPDRPPARTPQPGCRSPQSLGRVAPPTTADIVRPAPTRPRARQHVARQRFSRIQRTARRYPAGREQSPTLPCRCSRWPARPRQAAGTRPPPAAPARPRARHGRASARPGIVLRADNATSRSDPEFPAASRPRLAPGFPFRRVRDAAAARGAVHPRESRRSEPPPRRRACGHPG